MFQVFGLYLAAAGGASAGRRRCGACIAGPPGTSAKEPSRRRALPGLNRTAKGDVQLLTQAGAAASCSSVQVRDAQYRGRGAATVAMIATVAAPCACPKAALPKRRWGVAEVYRRTRRPRPERAAGRLHPSCRPSARRPFLASTSTVRPLP